MVARRYMSARVRVCVRGLMVMTATDLMWLKYLVFVARVMVLIRPAALLSDRPSRNARGTRSETLYSHYECVFMPHDKEKYAK